MDSKVLAVGAVGATLGAIQTPLLREYVDKKYPTWNIPSLGGFGTPSSLTGMVGGGIGLAVGAVGASKKAGVPRLSDTTVVAALDYGIVALVGGVMSGLFPTEASTSHMAPHVQQANMSAIQRLSSEVQRLSQENAQLRMQSPRVQPMQMQQQQPVVITNMQPLPGHVGQLQRRYGFMEPREPLAPQYLQPAPGQPTRRAKQYGFMEPEGSTGLTQVRNMKAKYDFLG